MHHIALLLVVAFPPDTASWEYPNTVGQSSHDSSNGDVVAWSFSKKSDDDFRTVAAWYAERTGLPKLVEEIDAYTTRDDDAPDDKFGGISKVSVGTKSNSLTNAVYSFSENSMHVTIVFRDEASGDSISISIAGGTAATSIQFVRQKSPAAPSAPDVALAN